MKIPRERVSAAPAQGRASRNVAHGSTVTRPHSAPSANVISNFPEAGLWVLIPPGNNYPAFADF